MTQCRDLGMDSPVSGAWESNYPGVAPVQMAPGAQGGR